MSKKLLILMLAMLVGVAGNLPRADAATVTITVSQNPADGATTDSLQEAFESLSDGDVATIEILDSATYETTADLMNGFENGTVHLMAAMGQFPTIAPQGNFDVFELDDNVGGTQLGDADGGRIKILTGGSDSGSPNQTIFYVRNDNTTPVVIENWLVELVSGETSPGSGTVLYNDQNTLPADEDAPPNELQLRNVLFDCNGQIRDGWRRQNAANVLFERVGMIDVFRFAIRTTGDAADPRNALDGDGNAIGDPGSVTGNLTTWSSTLDNAWRSQPGNTVGITWNFNRSLFISKGDAAPSVILQEAEDNEITMSRTGIVYAGSNANAIGFDDDGGDTAGDWQDIGWSFDHCAFYSTGICLNIEDGAQNRPVLVTNTNMYSDAACFVATPGFGSSISSNFNNLYSTDPDLLASGDVYQGVQPGANDIVPGQDPEYGGDVLLGNFTYANSFLYDKDSTGGPIGINDNFTDLNNYVIPNQVKYWNVY